MPAKPDSTALPPSRDRGAARRRRWLASLVWMLVGSAAWSAFARAAAAEITAKEPEVKAAYLFNFGVFVGWPPDRIPEGSGPFVIGVLGNNAVAAELEKIAHSSRVRGHKLVIRRLTPSSDLGECHVLFIGRDADFVAILGRLNAAGKTADGVLTVGEAEQFAERGGMIHLVLVKDTVRYDVNPAAAEKAGLKMSSQLLRAARQIKMAEAEKGGP